MTDPAQVPAPAEAATAIGADYDSTVPEGGAIVTLLVFAVALVLIAAALTFF